MYASFTLNNTLQLKFLVSIAFDIIKSKQNPRSMFEMGGKSNPIMGGLKGGFSVFVSMFIFQLLIVHTCLNISCIMFSTVQCVKAGAY